MTENGTVIKNKYDPLGFRYQKEVNGDTSRYIFDGWSIVAETNKEGELKSREVRGYSLVKKEKEETTYYYHQNEHGDVTHLTNNHEEIENSYSYDVFGNVREQQENVENIFKYTGEQFDKETQQYYLRARFYNPVVGRFTQEDVYRGDGLNLYVYVSNNPLLWVDPSGYAKKCKVNNDSSIKKINSYTYKHGVYEKANYHSSQTTGKKNPAPIDGQFSLDNSVPIGENTPRRIGLDINGEFVVLDQTETGTFHGHIRQWSSKGGNQGLTQEMKNALYKAGYIKASTGTKPKLTNDAKNLINGG